LFQPSFHVTIEEVILESVRNHDLL